jgi:hypothetical protein
MLTAESLAARDGELRMESRVAVSSLMKLGRLEIRST